MSSSQDWQRFICTKGTSNKYWEVRRDGHMVVTRWGRIGYPARYTRSDCGTETQAYAVVRHKIRTKRRKGYIRASGTHLAQDQTESVGVVDAGVTRSIGVDFAASGDPEAAFMRRLRAKVKRYWGSDVESS